MAEITAIGIYLRFWIPDVPQWLPSLIALLVLYGTNLLAVRVFGELEFWFALISAVLDRRFVRVDGFRKTLLLKEQIGGADFDGVCAQTF